jgi:hypothetical protein
MNSIYCIRDIYGRHETQIGFIVYACKLQECTSHRGAFQILSAFILRTVHQFRKVYNIKWGMRWCSGFRHCAANQRSLAQYPMVSSEFFIDINPSGCTMALGSTQSLTQMSTRNISWGVKVANA